MLSFSQNMKQAIVNDLQTLVDQGILKGVIVDDFTKLNPLDRTWQGYPSALVIPSTAGPSEYYDVGTNLRTYTWYVMVVTTPDNLPQSDPTYLEGLVDSVLGVFDQDVTMQGSAVGGVDPAVLEPPGPISSNSITYVVFYVTLKAKTLVPAAVKS